jgi:hypothetical protein
MKLVLGAALSAALMSSPACAGFAGVPLQPCDNRPPASARQPVGIPFSVFVVPGKAMFAVCSKQVGDLVIYGCTFPAAAGHPAIILLNADQNAAERACTLIYEEAHLPPNNWQDPVMEKRTPDAVAAAAPMLVELKR